MAWPTIMSDASAGDVLTAANLNTLVDAAQYLEAAWTLETGLLEASTTDPSALAVDACYYREVGKLMIVRWYYEWDGSTNNGSGNYRVRLPSAAGTDSVGRQTVVGVRNIGGTQSDLHGIAGASSGVFSLLNTTDASGWTTGDYLSCQGVVEIA